MKQNLILAEWPVCLHTRNQVFTCTGKFMHVLFEVHESYLFIPGMESLTAGGALILHGCFAKQRLTLQRFHLEIDRYL